MFYVSIVSIQVTIVIIDRALHYYERITYINSEDSARESKRINCSSMFLDKITVIIYPVT